MKELRTLWNARPASFSVGLSDPILTFGSCFSDSIGSCLLQHKFVTGANPFGTIYNPVSIHKALGYAIRNESPGLDTYVCHDDLWNSFDFHSQFATNDRETTSARIQQAIAATHQLLKGVKTVVLTYGTAWAYERLDSGQVVSNCHKVPASRFRKILLSPETIVSSFIETLLGLRRLQPSVNVILTVSPVRHLRDTMELNSVSKSALRLAVHTIRQQHPDVDYFPAFEIMLDDLRDYRFYEDDMLHPSPLAIRYIWEKFSERYFSTATRALLERWSSISNALQHKSFHPEGNAHRQFLRETLARLEELKSGMRVDEEIHLLRNLLS